MNRMSVEELKENEDSLNKVIALRDEWAEDCVRLSNEIAEWREHVGTGDAVWCLLIRELAYVDAQRKWCVDFAKKLIVKKYKEVQ